MISIFVANLVDRKVKSSFEKSTFKKQNRERSKVKMLSVKTTCGYDMFCPLKSYSLLFDMFILLDQARGFKSWVIMFVSV